VPGFPTVPVNAHTPSGDHAEALPPAAPARLSWARLLKRVFEIDLEHCPHCGGPLTIIAAIVDSTVICQDPCMLLWLVRYMRIVRALEAVGKGARGGKRAALSTASAPVRQRRIVHILQSPAPARCGSSSDPGAPKPVGERRAPHRVLRLTRTVAGANEPAFLQGGV
jgi:hypothetical protein